MKKIKSAIEVAKIATPSAPDSSHTLLYPDTDGNWNTLNSDGTSNKLTQTRVWRNTGSSGIYATRASNAAFDQANPTKFTIRAWILPTTTNTNNGVATRGALSGGQGDWALGFFNGTSMKPTFRVNTNAASVQSATTLATNTWCFLEGSYDSSLGSNNLKLFINGVLDTQGNYSTAITNNALQLVLGTYSDTAHCFIGYISEWELSIGVIRNTVGYTPPTVITPDANTTVLWRCNDTWPASTLADTSGNSRTATVQNGTMFFDAPYR